MIFPPQAKAAIAAVALIAAFGSGWTVRSWRCDSAIAKIERELQEARDKQAAKADAAAGANEVSRDAVDRQNYATNTVIRETYREIPVAAECAAPEPVAVSLQQAVDGSNGAASGIPAPAVP